jgi:hypothetical protein
MEHDSPGRAADTASPAATDEAELTTTVAPNSDRRRAVASPIPLDDPVTMATRLLNSGMRWRVPLTAYGGLIRNPIG